MKCTEIRKLLPDYSVGGLSRRKQVFVKHHIEDCLECIRELMHLDQTASLLNAIPQEESPNFLWEDVKEKITPCSHSVKTPFCQEVIGWLKWKRMPALVSSIVIFLLVMGLYLARWKSPTE